MGGLGEAWERFRRRFLMIDVGPHQVGRQPLDNPARRTKTSHETASRTPRSRFPQGASSSVLARRRGVAKPSTYGRLALVRYLAA